jgi:hypothetical protein
MPNQANIGNILTKRMAPVLNDPNESISIPFKIEVLRFWSTKNWRVKQIK